MRVGAELIRTLGRLEWLKARAFWRIAARDPVFMFAVFAGLTIAWFSARRLYQLASHETPALAVLVSTLAGAGVFWALYPGPRSLRGLIAGPFFPLVADGRMLARWLVARTAGFHLLTITLLSVAFASVDVGGAGVFLLAALSGGALAGLAKLRRPAAAAAQAASGGVQKPKARRPRHIASAAIGGLGAVAGLLATRNNDAPAMGLAVNMIAALAAALIVTPSGALTAFTGRERPSLVWVFLRLHGLSLIIAGPGAFAMGLVAGLGPVGGAEVAVGALTFTALIQIFLFLHRMIRSVRNASLSLSTEIGAALLAAAVQISLAPIWLVVRAFFLIRAARRRRWLDR